MGEKRLGVDVRGERKLWRYAEWVIAERKESNLRSWSLENRDAVSQHRGLSSGVASGKSVGSRRAYGWLVTSTPLRSCITPGVIYDKCFASGILIYIYVLILIIMLISYETVNDFIIRMIVWCFDQY